MPKEIKQTWFFNQPPQEVWDYLTRAELIEQWLMKTNFKPVKGYKFQFTFAPKEGSVYNGAVDCEVLEVEPFTKLTYSWNGSTKDGGRNYHSIVAWTLVPKGDGTELQLTHEGFTVLEDFIAHDGGWKKCLERFTELINAGKP